MLLVILLSTSVWSLSGKTGLNLNQNYYNQDWQGSESSSLSWIYDLNFQAERKFVGKYNFSDELKIEFGQTYLKDREADEWRDPEKSADRIENEGVLKVLFGWAVDPYLAFRFKSQFLDLSNDSLTRYFNPIELNQSAGASRDLMAEEDRKLETRFGFAVREILDRPLDTLNFTLMDMETRVDGGLEWVTKGRFQFSDNLRYQSELRVYRAFFNSESIEGEDDWKTLDVVFENTMTVSAMRIIEMTLGLDLIYEKEQTDNLQIKQNLTAGISVSLF